MNQSQKFIVDQLMRIYLFIQVPKLLDSFRWLHCINKVQEVASAMSILTHSVVKFLIRTTGHNPTAGISNADDYGVVLGLQVLREISQDDDGALHTGAGNA